MTRIVIENPIEAYAVRLGDDALVLGHRLSEWCSNAPYLEEDLALANVALDYIGRARMFFTYAAELRGDGTTEDDYAFLRDNREFLNLLINELPRGDFAYSMARQFFVDVFNLAFLEKLRHSTDKTLAGIAAKAIKETRYHLRRSRDWMLRLGDGTQESHARLQSAVEELWGFTPELFQADEIESSLAEQGIAVDRTQLEDGWRREVDRVLREANIDIPEQTWQVDGGRAGVHTEYLGHMLAEMQFMQRAYPGLEW